MKHDANKEIVYGTEINVIKTSFLSLSLSLSVHQEKAKCYGQKLKDCDDGQSYWVSELCP
jgi:hypothetical protein